MLKSGGLSSITYYDEELSKALFGLTWLIVIIEVPFFLGITQLVIFHIYLIKTK